MRLLSVDLSFPAWHRKQIGVRGGRNKGEKEERAHATQSKPKN